MKREILALAFTVLSNCAWAEWELLTRSDDGKLSRYIDPATVRKSGDVVKFWELSDFHNDPIVYQNGKKANSLKTQGEINCKDETWRVLYNIPFTGNMGGGAVIHTSEGEKKWYPVSPGSVSEAAFEFACGKR